MFGIKKTVNSEEYEKLLKKMAELENKVEVLNGKYKGLETNYDLLRGQFNRKLAGIRKEEALASLQGQSGDENLSGNATEAKDLNDRIPIGIGNGKILQP